MVIVTEPMDQVITCSVQAYPGVTIEWCHNLLPIRNDRKYQITAVPSEPYTANSTLMIRDLNATDNGVVSCIASTNGCNVTLSRGSCHPQVFTEQFDTKLNVISKLTGSIMYT